jgi:hypothetical protein
MKVVQWEPSSYMRTDRHDGANIRGSAEKCVVFYVRSSIRIDVIVHLNN